MSSGTAIFVKPIAIDGPSISVITPKLPDETKTVSTMDLGGKIEITASMSKAEADRFVRLIREQTERYGVEVCGVTLPGVYRKVTDQHGVRYERDFNWEETA